MRLTIPISRSDLHLLPEFVELHQHLKTAGLNHSLHFVVPQTIQSEAHDAKVSLDGLFESITVHAIDFEPYGGWPFAPNMHFWACSKAMHDNNPSLPWQLVELDCRPIRANAYDVIAAKYASCGAPFFGYVGKTPWRADNGKITKSLYGDSDEMMSGCAVYPGNLLDRPQMAGLMADFMKGESSIEVPWDMHLRFAMKAEGMAHTELIGNHWNTENYRIEDGRLVSDSRKEHEIFDQHPDWERRECGGPVHPDAVMVHGCKDDSLFNLVMSGAIPDASVRPAPVSYAVPQIAAPAPAQPSASDARIDKIEGMMAQMMAMMQKNSVGSDVVPGEPAQGVSLASPHETKTPADLIVRVLEALPEVGNKLRLGNLCAKLSTKKDAVKAALESSGKFTIKAPPAEWVERIAA